MRTDVGTWRDGQLVAKPKYNDIPDPLEREWKVQVFIKNQHGRIVPVTKWVAQDMLTNYGSRVQLVTEEDYNEQEKNWKDEPIKQSTMIRLEDFEKENKSNIEPDIEPAILEKQTEPVKVKKDEVSEKLDNLNQKFEQLTDAILKLASTKKKGKKWQK